MANKERKPINFIIDFIREPKNLIETFTGLVVAVSAFISLFENYLYSLVFVSLGILIGISAHFAFSSTVSPIQEDRKIPRYARWHTPALIGVVIFSALLLGSISYSLYQHLASPDTRQSLTILSALDENTYLVGEGETSNYQVGDDLIVYDEPIRDVETPIALLRIIAVNPNSLSAQAILVHPTIKIRPTFRVDDKVEQLSTSELVPSNENVVGYIFEPGRIRLRPGIDLAVGDRFQALEPQVIGEAIIDYLPFTPSILMTVDEIGSGKVVVSVELIEGEWPEPGTVVSIEKSKSTATDTPASPSLPSVFLMDSKEPQMIYNPEEPGTNTDRIRNILQYLPIKPPIEELVHTEWDDAEIMSQLEPDLIIIHHSAFYTSTTAVDPAKRFGSFLLAMEDTHTKFLIYSRVDNFSDEEGIKQYFENTYPFLEDRVDVLWVPKGETQYCTYWKCADTKEKLRRKVKSLLGLP